MKKIVFILVSLVVAVLVIGRNAFAQDNTFEAPPLIPSPYPYGPPIPTPPLGPEWELVFTGPNSGTTIYFNTKVTHLPGGIVKVRTLFVPRGEFRRTLVNDLKKLLLSEGKNPNIAKRLWYVIELDKFNCKNNQIDLSEGITYSFGQAVLDHHYFQHYFQHEKWDDIPPGSAEEAVEKDVCK